MSSLPPCELLVCQFAPTLKRKPFHTCKMIIILMMILMLIWNPGALDTKTRCWIKHFLHRISDSRGVIIMSSTPRIAPGAICLVFSTTWSANTAFSLETQSDLHSDQQVKAARPLEAEPSSNKQKNQHYTPWKGDRVSWSVAVEPTFLCVSALRAFGRAHSTAPRRFGGTDRPAEATLALMSLIASHHSDGESRWSGRSSRSGVIQLRPSGHRVEDNEALWYLVGQLGFMINSGRYGSGRSAWRKKSPQGSHNNLRVSVFISLFCLRALKFNWRGELSSVWGPSGPLDTGCKTDVTCLESGHDRDVEKTEIAKLGDFFLFFLLLWQSSNKEETLLEFFKTSLTSFICFCSHKLLWNCHCCRCEFSSSQASWLAELKVSKISRFIRCVKAVRWQEVPN